MALTPEDVRNKQFSTAKRKSGYEMDEVDAFLDQVELELGALQRENAELRGRLAAAEQGAARAVAAPAQAPAVPGTPAPPAPPVQVQNVNEQAVAMLALAQRTAEEHTTRARIEADDLVAAAKAKVVELERQGQIDRAALERRVEELRAFEREYRTRLRQHYESALRDLDGREAPAAPAAPVASTPAAPAAAPAPPAPAAPAVPAAPTAPAVQVPPPPPGYQAPAPPAVPGTAGPTLTPPPPPPSAPNPYTPPPAQG